MLSQVSDDVRIIGIWRCGGIGKTTTSRAIFKRISNQFEGCSFLHEVRDSEEKHGLVRLQNTLLSEILMEGNLSINNVYEGVNRIRQRLCRRRVLIVLDDVHKLDQLEKLAGEHDWFGLGRRIIITIRDKHLLDELEVDGIYEIGFLKDVEAIRVFSKKAFKEGHPKKGYEELSDHVVKYAVGLPLALKVLGFARYHKNKDMWEDALDKLKKRVPGCEILDTLKISYDYLDDSEKDIFLDIACFFNGHTEDYVTRILDSFGFNPKIGISVLVEKSLISRSENTLGMHHSLLIARSENTLGMHHLLQELGWDIVRQESPKEPGKRSRLFHFDDIKNVLMNNTGTKRIEGILLPNTPTEELINASTVAFTKMSRLRFLEIQKCHRIPKCPKHLSKELRWLDWDYFPSESMPPSFQAGKLVGIKMHHSSIVRLWKEKNVLNELKYIDLSHSSKLIKTPDFTAAPNLMELVLQCCENLVEVHSSIGLLKRLVLIDLWGCINLQILPNSIKSKALKIFNLSRCTKLEKFPEDLGYLECLEELNLYGTAIRDLPSSIGNLTSLVLIDLRHCRYLRSLPSTICMLKCLKRLYLCSCPNLDRLPDGVESLECLEELRLDGIPITELPPSIVGLKNLQTLSLSRSSSCTFSRLSSRTLELPPLSGLYRRPNCNLLGGSIPGDHGSLECLELPPSIARLYSLRTLELVNCKLLGGSIPSDLGSLSSLEQLLLGGSNVVSLPESICELPRLQFLSLVSCTMLEALPKLPSSLTTLHADDCTSLKIIYTDRFTMFQNLKTASFSGCLGLLEDSNICSTLWLHRLQGLSKIIDFGFCIWVPGKKILQWFSNQNIGRRISMKLPQCWYTHKLLGFAICVVVTRTYSRTGCKFHFIRHNDMTEIQYIEFHEPISLNFFESGHVCLSYIPLSQNFPKDEHDSPKDWCEVEVSFESEVEVCCESEVEVSCESEVISCGLRLVYEDDVKPRDVDEFWVPSKKIKLHQHLDFTPEIGRDGRNGRDV